MSKNNISIKSKPTAITTALMCIFVLGGCSSDSYDDDIVTPEPAPEAPAPVVNDFPVQSALPAPQTLTDVGAVFTSEVGLSLYYFANDEQGVSNCNAEDGAAAGGSADTESCAGRWPPLLAADGTTAQAPFTLVERADATMQWAYNGFPLYTFGDDSAQGDVNGDGLGDVWDLARPNPFSTNENGYIVGNQNVLTGSNPAGTFETQRAEKEGFTLYTFDGDSIDTSNCFSTGCINVWPPLLADNGNKPSGLYDVIEVQDDTYQWTFRGKPMYFFANDVEAGDASGNTANAAFIIGSKKPATQRLINDVSWLTADGKVNMLSFENDAVVEVNDVDKDQFSLYTFTRDELNTSNCNNGCLTNFPAFLASEFDAPIGSYDIIERDDGFMQWTYEGEPLYFATADTAIDDTNGHEVGDVWFLISPASTDIQAQGSSIGNTVVTQGFTNTYNVDGDGVFSSVLQDTSGRQLYTFDNDNAAQSNCVSTGCIGNWPALLAKAGEEVEAPFSTFDREDGSIQIALNDKPLYLFTPDTQAGDQNGEGAGDVWFVARPAPMKLVNITNDSTGFVAHRLDIQGNELNDTSKEGFTLYTFNNDVADSGISNCVGGCANAWPPLLAAGTEQAFGSYSIIERLNDESETVYQWAYAGKPLYFFRDDEEQADNKGLANPNFQIANVN